MLNYERKLCLKTHILMLISTFRVNKCLFDIQGSSWISSCTDSRAQDVSDRGQRGCGAVRRQA